MTIVKPNIYIWATRYETKNARNGRFVDDAPPNPVVLFAVFHQFVFGPHGVFFQAWICFVFYRRLADDILLVINYLTGNNCVITTREKKTCVNNKPRDDEAHSRKRRNGYYFIRLLVVKKKEKKNYYVGIILAKCQCFGDGIHTHTHTEYRERVAAKQCAVCVHIVTRACTYIIKYIFFSSFTIDGETSGTETVSIARRL